MAQYRAYIITVKNKETDKEEMKCPVPATSAKKARDDFKKTYPYFSDDKYEVISNLIRIKGLNNWKIVLEPRKTVKKGADNGSPV